MESSFGYGVLVSGSVGCFVVFGLGGSVVVV